MYIKVRQIFVSFVLFFISLFFSNCLISKDVPRVIAVIFNAFNHNYEDGKRALEEQKKQIEEEREEIMKMRAAMSIKPDNQIEYMDSVEIFGTGHKWITQPSDNYSMTILRTEKPENKVEYTNEIVLLSEEKPENIVEERDSITISSLDKEPLQTEYLDELLIERINKPDNEIQIVDQMEILGTEKPENEIEYMDSVEILGTKTWETKPSETYEMTILRTEKPENIVEERDSITILGEEKPENKVEYTNEIVLLGEEKPENVVEERDSITISSLDKEPLQTEYLDELFIQRITKPENEIRNSDSIELLGTRTWGTKPSETYEMTILKTEKPDNEIEYMDSVEIFGTKTWQTKPSETYSMGILRTEKPENKVEFTNEISLLGDEKPENIVEERDSITILGEEKPENKVEEKDSIIISSLDKEPLQTEYLDELFIKGTEVPNSVDNEVENNLEFSIIAESSSASSVRNFNSNLNNLNANSEVISRRGNNLSNEYSKLVNDGKRTIDYRKFWELDKEKKRLEEQVESLKRLLENENDLQEFHVSRNKSLEGMLKEKDEKLLSIQGKLDANTKEIEQLSGELKERNITDEILKANGIKGNQYLKNFFDEFKKLQSENEENKKIIYDYDIKLNVSELTNKFFFKRKDIYNIACRIFNALMQFKDKQEDLKDEETVNHLVRFLKGFEKEITIVNDGIKKKVKLFDFDSEKGLSIDGNEDKDASLVQNLRLIMDIYFGEDNVKKFINGLYEQYKDKPEETTNDILESLVNMYAKGEMPAMSTQTEEEFTKQEVFTQKTEPTQKKDEQLHITTAEKFTIVQARKPGKVTKFSESIIKGIKESNNEIEDKAFIDCRDMSNMRGSYCTDYNKDELDSTNTKNSKQEETTVVEEDVCKNLLNSEFRDDKQEVCQNKSNVRSNIQNEAGRKRLNAKRYKTGGTDLMSLSSSYKQSMILGNNHKNKKTIQVSTDPNKEVEQINKKSCNTDLGSSTNITKTGGVSNIGNNWFRKIATNKEKVNVSGNTTRNHTKPGSGIHAGNTNNMTNSMNVSQKDITYKSNLSGTVNLGCKGKQRLLTEPRENNSEDGNNKEKIQGKVLFLNDDKDKNKIQGNTAHKGKVEQINKKSCNTDLGSSTNISKPGVGSNIGNKMFVKIENNVTRTRNHIKYNSGIPAGNKNNMTNSMNVSQKAITCKNKSNLLSGTVDNPGYKCKQRLLTEPDENNSKYENKKNEKSNLTTGTVVGYNYSLIRTTRLHTGPRENNDKNKNNKSKFQLNTDHNKEGEKGNFISKFKKNAHSKLNTGLNEKKDKTGNGDIPLKKK